MSVTSFEDETDPRAVLRGVRDGPRWRLTLHRRPYFVGMTWQSRMLGELTHARGRRLEQQLNKPAQLTFTLDGRSAAAVAAKEFETEVIAWRYVDSYGQDTYGNYTPYFRGVITAAEDQLTPQVHVTSYTCHDYSAILDRRFVTRRTPINFLTSQDQMVQNWVQAASVWGFSGDQLMGPGTYLPLATYFVHPNGTQRSELGPLRGRQLIGGKSYGEAISQLAAVIDGFDYDSCPANRARFNQNDVDEHFRIFYPQQGVTRNDPTLTYGGSVTGLTRYVKAADYANYVRSIGNNENPAADAPQLIGEAWNADATSSAPTVGTWGFSDGGGADINDQNTLNDRARAILESMSRDHLASYTLTLRRGFYKDELFNLGDRLRLVVESGRLHVNDYVRVVGMAFGMEVDGSESVEVTVGRPGVALGDELTALRRDIAMLERT